jgi:hypothetical protein
VTTVAYDHDQKCSHGKRLASWSKFSQCQQCIGAAKAIDAYNAGAKFDAKKLTARKVPAKLKAAYDEAHAAWLRGEIEDFRVRDGALLVTPKGTL